MSRFVNQANFVGTVENKALNDTVKKTKLYRIIRAACIVAFIIGALIFALTVTSFVKKGQDQSILPIGIGVIITGLSIIGFWVGKFIAEKAVIVKSRKYAINELTKCIDIALRMLNDAENENIRVEGYYLKVAAKNDELTMYSSYSGFEKLPKGEHLTCGYLDYYKPNQHDPLGKSNVFFQSYFCPNGMSKNSREVEKILEGFKSKNPKLNFKKTKEKNYDGEKTITYITSFYSE